MKDNAGLFHALSSGLPVLPVFIFDKNILDDLEERADKRVSFIYNALLEIQKQLAKTQSGLVAGYDYPESFFQNLISEYSIDIVFSNHDYEPYATARDKAVHKILAEHNIRFKTFKDQVVFEKEEVVKNDGSFYSVYTPYSNKWLQSLNEKSIQSFDSQTLLANFFKHSGTSLPPLKSMMFEDIETIPQKVRLKKSLISSYNKTRNIPSIEGTSRLGIYLRFGTISIRELVKKVQGWNSTFLKELIWREFFMQILWHNPHVVHYSFKPEYDNIQWRNNKKEFDAWCNGMTGYPILDAGMRQLNETGFMHNRVRMITASFLVKHLLVDWRWGEAYFAKKLLDYELASNNGNWQWVAGCGCDAAPYFRIFNPDIQTKKFDPEEKYIKQWVPEYKSANYPSPIVQHQFGRERCLSVYKKASSQKSDTPIQTNLFDHR